MTERLISKEVVPYTPVFAIGQLTSEERKVDCDTFEGTTRLTSTGVVLYTPIFAIRQLLSKHGVDRSTSAKIRTDMDWETAAVKYRLIQHRSIGQSALYQLRIDRRDDEGQSRTRYDLDPKTPDQAYYSTTIGDLCVPSQEWPVAYLHLDEHLATHSQQ